MKNTLVRQKRPKGSVDILCAIVRPDHLHLNLKLVLHICMKVLKTLKHLILMTQEVNPRHTRIAVDEGNKVPHSIN